MAIDNAKQIVDTITQIAQQAAHAMKQDLVEYRKVEQNLPRDVKVAADRRLESQILENLFQHFEYPILSEESGEVEGADQESGYYWIVDPLDGSVNFSRGFPLCCISIALWHKNNPILGMIYDFNQEEVFTGIVGEGAWLNGNPMACSAVDSIGEAVLCTGFPNKHRFTEEALLAFTHKVKDYKKIRLLGSAALSMAYVACGRADSYREHHIKLWDIAAGAALILAAGGQVTTAPSEHTHAVLIHATNSHLDASI